MGAWHAVAFDLIWRNGLAVVPLAALVALVGRWSRCRPVTRHTLWLIVLAWFVAPALPPQLSIPFGLPVRATPGPSKAQAATGDRVSAPVAADDVKAGIPNGIAETPARTTGQPRFASLPTERPRRSVSPAPPAVRPYAVDARREWPAPDSLAVGLRAPCSVALRVYDVVSDSPPTHGSRPSSQENNAWGKGESVHLSTERVASLPIIRGADSLGGSADPEPIEIAAAIRQAWQSWSAGLLRVRDAIVTLPTIPPGICYGGAAVILLIGLFRVFRAHRWLSQAEPAPSSVVGLVSDAARSVGLGRVPETFMVRSCISPLICFGRRTRLLLPVELWAQLDDEARRAVIVHELAHLRRRDHWVRWAETAIGCLYWWHPLLWWVRRRLREEAELCCDAWVTWLMPQQRRAYAEALLTTKRYVREQPAAVPPWGIGVMTGRAKRLTRRITMVMTGNAKPGLSVSGVAVAVVLAIGGWATMPAWSCPPKPTCDETPAGGAVSAVIVDPDAAEESVEGSTFEEYLVGKSKDLAIALGYGGVYALAGDRDDSTEDLEKKLAKIEKRVHQLAKQLEGIRKAFPRAAARGRARADSPQAFEYAVPRAPRAFFSADQSDLSASNGEPVWKTYKLSKGKLKEFTELMVRSDVPILVRPSEEGIDIQATESQHAVFNAFFNMIDPSDDRRAGAAPFPSASPRMLALPSLPALPPLAAPPAAQRHNCICPAQKVSSCCQGCRIDQRAAALAEIGFVKSQWSGFL